MTEKAPSLANAKLDPVDLRRKIFQATQQFGLPTTSKTRQILVESVASKMVLTVEDLEEFMYSDIDDELVLEKFLAPSASELLAEYNLSLTQTLLFNATELSFTSTCQLAILSSTL